MENTPTHTGVSVFARPEGSPVRYVVTGDEGIVLATISDGEMGGYIVRCYFSPDEYSLDVVTDLERALEIAERYALRITA